MIKTKNKQVNAVFNNFERFAKNFIYIIDNNNDKIRFEINEAQKEIDKLMNDNRFIVIGKARQAGISTFVLAKALWRAVINENENILIVSYKADSKDALFEKLKLMNDYLPRDHEKLGHLFPATRRDNRDELLLANGSRVTCVTAGNKSIGRGSTYSYIHLSEFAFYSRQEQQLLSAEQALMKGEHSQLTIETTSNGVGNHFYQLMTSAVKGESKYKAYFVPFFHDLYKKQFKYEHDEAEKWNKNYYGKRLMAKDLERDEKPLYDMGANLRFLMWRRYKLMDMTEQEFQQEYPSNYLESFISTGTAIFDQSSVLQALNVAREPLHKQELINEIPKLLHKYIGRGLNIWQLPKAKIPYYAGIDTASGSGNDSSTIIIFNNEGEQVLSFNHNKVPLYLFADIVDEIGNYYNQAFLTIERNSFGLPLLEKLKKEKNYRNLFRHKMFDKRTGKRKKDLGFLTTESTKAGMISLTKEQFEKGLIKIECKETLKQMQMFIEHSNGSLGNKRGENNHDDLVIALGLCLEGIKANRWYVRL